VQRLGVGLDESAGDGINRKDETGMVERWKRLD
jgi:hypothetical protein